MNKYFFLFTVLLIISCATNKTQTKLPTNEVTSPNIEAMQKLNEDSPEYSVVSFRAAEDIKQISSAALNTHDSILALKASSLGVYLFPYRSDIINLKRSSVAVVKQILQKMIESKKYSCAQINERYELLSQVAPDESSGIKMPSFEGCVFKNISTKEFEYKTLIKARSSAQSKEVDKKYSDAFDKALDAIITANANVPFYDILETSVSFMAKYYGYKYTDFKIHKSTQDTQNVKMCSSDVEKNTDAVWSIRSIWPFYSPPS